jgi:hypothetical protein
VFTRTPRGNAPTHPKGFLLSDFQNSTRLLLEKMILVPAALAHVALARQNTSQQNAAICPYYRAQSIMQEFVRLVIPVKFAGCDEN